jgi:hypothetical protein
LLARFYERTVGDERFAVAHPNDGRDRRRLQWRCVDILPLGVKWCVSSTDSSSICCRLVSLL